MASKDGGLEMNKEHQFNLLDETSVSEDLFEDQTHQKIASTLYDVIQNGNSEGITIGLEGGWGSGKSTVVSILRKKLEKAKDSVRYFYFDAWAHEGDPLRRIFLEAFIDQVGRDDKKLQDIRIRLSNRKKISKTESKQIVTTLGKLLTFAAFFVPFGVAMISATASEIGFQWHGDINWEFLLGVVCSMAPVIVLMINLLRLIITRKKIFDPNNWRAFRGESESTITQEVSEDEERSSIEFEKYFCEILDVILSKNENTKLLLVIDNLDRVDPADSMKIWSTLQTFLQRRNPIDKGYSYLKRIWILVPYDEEGLEKLWRDRSSKDKVISPDGSASEENHDKVNRGCAKSFFDKCFQLRIEVPKLTLSGWESFCKDNIERALISWEENEKEEVLNVLKWTRESVTDIPTPRDIKTYINQIGLLRLHCAKEISTTAIAYFAVQKYIKFHKNSEIEEQLIAGKLPIDKHKTNFSPQLPAELCGILFGVYAEKGQQLLLEPEIEKALKYKRIDRVKKLVEIHKSAFWTVLNLHLPNMKDFYEIRSYSFTVWKGLWEAYPDRCANFINYLKVSVDGLKSLEFPEQEDLGDYIAIFTLLDFGKYDFSKIWRLILESLSEKIRKGNFDFSNGNKILSNLASCQKQKIPTQHTLYDVPFENWIKWAKESNLNKTNSYELVKPPDNIVNEIASGIKANKPIPDSLYDLLEYLIETNGEITWEPVINNIKVYIEWNNGTPSSNIFSIEIFKILTLLSVMGQNILKSFEQILTKGPFYNLAFHLKGQGALKYSSLLLARFSPSDLDSIQIPGVGNSKPALQEVKNFWKTTSTENAQFIWNEVKPKSDFEFIWKLARSENNKLIGDIIKIAIKENCSEFFHYTNALQLFKAARIITGNEKAFNKELVRSFIVNSQIENEIIANDAIDATSFSYELYLLIENIRNKELNRHLIDKISSLSKEQWNDALNNDTYLTTLAISIHKKTSGLQLGDDLYEPLLQYLLSWISNSIDPSEAQRDELSALIYILKEDFQIQLKDRLTNHIIEIGFKGSSAAISSLLEHIDIGKIITEGKSKIQSTIEDSVRKSEIETLKIFDMILSHKDGVAFRPGKHLTEVLKSPMKEFYNSNTENKELIERLAKKFGVDLSKP